MATAQTSQHLDPRLAGRIAQLRGSRGGDRISYVCGTATEDFLRALTPRQQTMWRLYPSLDGGLTGEFGDETQPLLFVDVDERGVFALTYYQPAGGVTQRRFSVPAECAEASREIVDEILGALPLPRAAASA